MSFLMLDSSTAGAVSIKVVDASESTKKNHELEVLEHLQANDNRDSHPGSSNVAQLLDSFVHEGPNGQHLCVVMELLGPTLPQVAQISPECRLKAHLVRHVSGQIVKAVAYLHSCGVTHGDIHTGNILFRLPKAAIAGLLSESPVTGKMSKKDGSALEVGVPKYLVKPLEYDITAFALDSGDIQLVDFGSEWIREAIATGLLLGEPEDRTNDFLPLEEEIKRHYFDESPSETLEFTRQDLEKLGKYLRRMLIVDPKQRAVAAELVSDTSWVNANG
ncbi:hypothetical protein LQW54_010283 [Pestalotiopsis sp. IQ-011]